MIQFILLDIEGTTTSISFVHEVLFPYASQHIEDFVSQHASEERIQKQLQAVKQTVKEEKNLDINDQAAIEELLLWIKTDRKHTALKAIQGYLWRDGYESGQYKGHIYEDVVPALERWQQEGIQMGIYSSGSVEAQKLLFGYSEKGDLTPYFSAYFDTNIGHKREKESYDNIQKELGIPPQKILFLSDVEAELDAARGAGFQTAQLLRPGTISSDRFNTVYNFLEIDLDKY